MPVLALGTPCASLALRLRALLAQEALTREKRREASFVRRQISSLLSRSLAQEALTLEFAESLLSSAEGARKSFARCVLSLDEHLRRERTREMRAKRASEVFLLCSHEIRRMRNERSAFGSIA